MKKRKRIKKLIISTVIILFIILCFFVGKKIYYKLNTNDVNVVDKIDKYSYTLEDRDTDLYKENYNNLKNILNEKEINYEDYAKQIAKLFIIDLYTLDNKLNKYDIGGTEFIYPDTVANYKLNAQETMYKYIENDIDKKRKQNLPEVSEIEISDISETTFTMNEKEYEGYTVDLTWSYKIDYEYDKSGKVTLISQDEILYIVEYKSN